MSREQEQAQEPQQVESAPAQQFDQGSQVNVSAGLQSEEMLQFMGQPTGHGGANDPAAGQASELSSANGRVVQLSPTPAGPGTTSGTATTTATTTAAGGATTSASAGVTPGSGPAAAYPYAHEEAPFAARLAGAGLANAAGIAKLTYEGLAAGGDQSKFNDAAKLVPLPIIAPGKQIAFWSGWGCEKAAQNSGHTTLDKVKLGQIGQCLQSGDSNWQAKQPLWRAISRRFASVTRGQCQAFIGFSKYDKVGGINPASVFAKAEKDEIDKMAAGHPEYRLSIKYHWVAAVHDIENGKLGDDAHIRSTADALPASTNEGSSPTSESLYWVTGNPSHVGFSFKTNWIQTHQRTNGTPVKGHLRGV